MNFRKEHEIKMCSIEVPQQNNFSIIIINCDSITEVEQETDGHQRRNLMQLTPKYFQNSKECNTRLQTYETKIKEMKRWKERRERFSNEKNIRYTFRTSFAE